MAFLTRSEVIRPLAARLLMRAALLEPELRHAIVLAPQPAPPPMTSRTVWIRYDVAVIAARSPQRAFQARFTNKKKESGSQLVGWRCCSPASSAGGGSIPTPR